MIRRDRGEFVCECTECGGEYAGGVIDDFCEFVEALKADGWLIRKEGDEWVHLCEVCREGVGP